MATRVGLGFDVHAFSDDPDRRLVLGGVAVPAERGLAGHSDADVVCHAVADALLGAGGLGDLGEHFPDSDPAFEGIAGLDLLTKVVALLLERGLVPGQGDLTLVADRPRIAEHREEVRRNLPSRLGLVPENVAVKAPRPEGLGLTGDGAGCMAIATVEPTSSG